MSDLIDISKVDFNDIEGIVGFATLILAHANQSGIIGGTASRQSREVIHITETAKRWVNGVKYMLPEMSVADAFKLVDLYDLIHRIGFRKPADTSFIDKLILDAFDARIHGDKSVDEYSLYYAIDIQIRKKNRKFLDKPLRWLSISLDRWYRDFKNNDWMELSDYDILRQCCVLLRADLFVFDANQDDFKKKLVKDNRHYLDETEGMTLPELEALSKFLSCSGRYMTQDEHMKYNDVIINVIIMHPDINPYYRQSLEMNLALVAE